ncbi:MAG: AIR synthase family protein [Candidatus Krumholzibacteriota bacterium]|nr:AIR synthase family protein [Candidatus Krumholzibacteriota bacterium]
MSKSKLPDLGKIHPEFFDRVIYPRLGVEDESVVMGPRHGVDYGVIRFGDRCLAMSSDPFFIMPEYGFSRAAWFAFHIVFCDVAVSGLTPRYLTIDLNLPPSITEAELEELWQVVHDESCKYGITILTGHTARYTGCNYPMVGGATTIAEGPVSDLRGPHLVKTGDSILITKGAAVEATGLLAAGFPKHFIKAGGEQFRKEAEDIFYKMSVMDDCIIARRFRGVRAMHDATECGIWGGLFEMARAGSFGLRIDKSSIPILPVVARTAELFDFDPFCAISEGTLIAIAAPEEAGDIVSAMNAEGIECAIVGEVLDNSEGMKIEENGSSVPLEHPKSDPYWRIAAELAGSD